MTDHIHWGILGTGNIALRFAHDLNLLPMAKLLAIGSRKLQTAKEFGRRYDIPRAYNCYEDLVNDKDIDVVYIATPNSRHKDDCILALKAGKHILCEKPFALNAIEASEIIDLAKESRLFCMEGMWMRFFPLIQKVKDLIQNGEIGDIRMLQADFGTIADPNPQHRFFNIDLGGGALLDRGIYLLSLAYFLFGTPSQMACQSSMGQTQVDEQAAMILRFPDKKLAVLSTSILSELSNEAIITGSLGTIKIHSHFYCPTKISIKKLSKNAAPLKSTHLKEKRLRNV